MNGQNLTGISIELGKIDWNKKTETIIETDPETGKVTVQYLHTFTSDEVDTIRNYQFWPPPKPEPVPGIEGAHYAVKHEGTNRRERRDLKFGRGTEHDPERYANPGRTAFKKRTIY